MQRIDIRPDVLEISFIHAQQPDKNKFIQIPSDKLEQIINEWVDKQPVAASYPPLPSQPKEFVWNDYLVGEFINELRFKDPLLVNRQMNDFKEKKSSPPSTAEKETKPDWEIVSYKGNTNGVIWSDQNTVGENYLRNFQNPEFWLTNPCLEKFTIHAVKRLPDGFVFTVRGVYFDSMGREMKPIKKFFQDRGVMYAQFDEACGSNDGCLGINSLGDLTAAPQSTTNEQAVYTQTQLDEAIEMAFNAARKKDVNSLSSLDQKPFPVYPTFEIYKQFLSSSLPEKKESEPVRTKRWEQGLPGQIAKEKPLTTAKPPLGVMPEWRHKELRLQDLDEAIKRYCEVKKAVPVEWIVETYLIREWLENRKEAKQ